MKRTLSFVIFALALMQFGIIGSMSSCTKTNTVYDTVRITHTDTLQEKDTLLTPTILTATPWKLQYATLLYGNNVVRYVRGGASNTQSFDNEFITFNSNGTGIYTDDTGTQTTLTWSFTDATNKKLIWVWNLPTPITITWDNLVYDDNAIRYTESYNNSGVNYVGSEMRIPK
jgi:hypothetical protein